MRGVIVEEFGGPDVLRLRDLPVPRPSPGQVVIEVRCAGVNFAEVMSRRAGYLGVQPPFVPGMEVAGTVLEVGPGVDRLSAGDRVCAMTMTGGYAEAAVADAARTFPLPTRLDWPVAAALPIIVPTAYALVHRLGRVRSGETVVVTAAAGGTGMVLGQMARNLGARTVGVVSSAEKVDAARGYGFDEVLTPGELDAGALEAGSVDLVLDSVGGAARSKGWEVLAPFGTLVAFGNASGDPEEPRTPAELRTCNHQLAGFSITALAQSAPDLLAAIAKRSFALVADGTVVIDIGSVVPLDRVADTHREMEARRTTGKTILAVK
jgi:NADPH2:quinone reductase